MDASTCTLPELSAFSLIYNQIWALAIHQVSVAGLPAQLEATKSADDDLVPANPTKRQKVEDKKTHH